MSDPIEEILMLPFDERLKVAATILDSISKDSTLHTLTAAQNAELMVRRKQYEEGNMKFISWEQMKHNIRTHQK